MLQRRRVRDIFEYKLNCVVTVMTVGGSLSLERGSSHAHIVVDVRAFQSVFGPTAWSSTFLKKMVFKNVFSFVIKSFVV
jgi:hypothetical protein